MKHIRLGFNPLFEERLDFLKLPLLVIDVSFFHLNELFCADCLYILKYDLLGDIFPLLIDIVLSGVASVPFRAIE